MKIRILPLLSILLVCTIVGRTFALSNEALSSEAMSVETKPEHAKPEVQKDHSAPKEAANADQQCVSGDVLEAINEKMRTLNLREEEMQQKEAAFSAIETRLKKQLAAVEAAKKSLDESVKKRTTLAEEDISHLTGMYTTMKPKQAALIFNKMDPNFAAGFLREMKSGHAGLIMASMETKQAYQISLIIASRGAKYRPAAE